MRLEHLAPLLDPVLEGLLLAEGAEGADDRDVDVVVLAGRCDPGLGEVGHLLVLAGGEERPAQ
ncbi:MAG TPA: hypothetical protein VLL75_17520, partial [Vicinamibacteria bacterium]|nr:hypothetical protein [Vicinamibacteria bacterium]